MAKSKPTLILLLRFLIRVFSEYFSSGLMLQNSENICQLSRHIVGVFCTICTRKEKKTQNKKKILGLSKKKIDSVCLWISFADFSKKVSSSSYFFLLGVHLDPITIQKSTFIDDILRNCKITL